MIDWRAAYRSMDQGGSPDAADAVAWRWIDGLASQVAEYCPGQGEIDVPLPIGGCRVIVLYIGRKPFAAATVYRDQMNFAVLLRWMAP